MKKAHRTVERDGSEHFTLEIIDPMPALKELVRILGLITEKHGRTVKGGLDLTSMSHEELDRLEHALSS